MDINRWLFVAFVVGWGCFLVFLFRRSAGVFKAVRNREEREIYIFCLHLHGLGRE